MVSNYYKRSNLFKFNTRTRGALTNILTNIQTNVTPIAIPYTNKSIEISFEFLQKYLLRKLNISYFKYLQLSIYYIFRSFLKIN